MIPSVEYLSSIEGNVLGAGLRQGSVSVYHYCTVSICEQCTGAFGDGGNAPGRCPICGSATSKHTGNVSGRWIRTYGCGTIISTCKYGMAYSVTTPYGHTALEGPTYGCMETT